MASFLDRKKVLVLGAMGRSGKAITELLTDCGAVVAITDTNTDGNPPVPVEKDFRPAQGLDLLDEFKPDVLVTAPGIPFSLPIFEAAESRGIEVYGEMDLSFRIMEERGAHPYVFAITGTDGKSTSVSLLEHLVRGLRFAPSVVACGNIGLPLSQVILDGTPDLLVVECSSFQLERIHYFHAQSASILNLADAHLDRYESIQEYGEAKVNIGLYQGSFDLLVLSEDFPSLPGLSRLHGRIERLDVQSFAPSVETFLERLQLPGQHNRWNLMFCLRMLQDYFQRNGMTWEDYVPDLESAIANFRGLPHRMEIVAQKNGLLFINDSKATTIQSALVAFHSFENRPLHLLMGGLDKHSDFHAFAGGHARIYPFGQAGRRVAEHTGAEECFETLEEAFYSACEHAHASLPALQTNQENGPVILLSPGCASQDAYKNYEERGKHFRELAESYK